MVSSPTVSLSPHMLNMISVPLSWIRACDLLGYGRSETLACYFQGFIMICSSKAEFQSWHQNVFQWLIFWGCGLRRGPTGTGGLLINLPFSDRDLPGSTIRMFPNKGQIDSRKIMRQMSWKCSGTQIAYPLKYPFANRPRGMLGQGVDELPRQEVLRTTKDDWLRGSERGKTKMLWFFCFKWSNRNLGLGGLWQGWWHLAGIAVGTAILWGMCLCCRQLAGVENTA